MKFKKILPFLLFLILLPSTLSIVFLALSKQTMNQGIEALLPEVVPGTLYKSEIQHFDNGREACVVCCVPGINDGTERRYDINVLVSGGLFGNTIILNHVDSYLLSEINDIDKSNISIQADTFLTKGNSPYAAVYYGLAPKDVAEISINGQNATIVHQSLKVDGTVYSANVYYCFIPMNGEQINEYNVTGTVSSFKVNVA